MVPLSYCCRLTDVNRKLVIILQCMRKSSDIRESYCNVFVLHKRKETYLRKRSILDVNPTLDFFRIFFQFWSKWKVLLNIIWRIIIWKWIYSLVFNYYRVTYWCRNWCCLFRWFRLFWRAPTLWKVFVVNRTQRTNLTKYFWSAALE